MTRRTLLATALVIAASSISAVTANAAYFPGVAENARVTLENNVVPEVVAIKKKKWRPTYPRRPGPRPGESRNPFPFG